MAQHDYVIDNQSAPTARSDINNALQALLTHNSGATAPSTTVANMIWYDTANDLLKMRNEANSGWITLGTVDQTNNVFNPNFLPATQVEAEAGTDNTKGMTALRVAQAIAALASAGTTVNIQTFTATGTYTPTSGYKYGIAFVTGGGGGGGGVSSGSTGGNGGGGAGGTAIGLLNLTTLGAVTATVGAAGTAGSSGGGSGGNGGSSTLSTLTGAGGNGSSGGGGGAATGGSINITGASGTEGSLAPSSGAGGGSFWGGGAKPRGTSNVGSTADAYGSGGGGALNVTSGTARVGGAGKAGVIMIMEFK